MSSNPAFVVRPMVSADLKEVLQFRERLRRQHAVLGLDAVWKADWLFDFMASASTFCLVACKELPVGYLLAETRTEGSTSAWLLHVREIYVEEASRLLGCGTGLMDEARVQAERLHCAHLSVNVREENPCAGFFNGLGFSAFSTEYRATT